MRLPGEHFLSAAEGWLDLGMAAEAMAELKSVPLASRRDARFLALMHRTLVAQGQWEDALLFANRWTQRLPNDPDSWIALASTLEKVPVPHGGLQAAWDVLRPRVDTFPEDGRFPVKLASYAIHLNRPRQAEEWLAMVMKQISHPTISRIVQEDEALKKMIAGAGSSTQSGA